MSNQDFQREGTNTDAQTKNKKAGVKEAASEAFAKASDAARDAGSKAKQAAADTATTVTDHVKDLLDRQIGQGVTAAGHLASSIKQAADEIDRESPLVAGVIRTVANRMEDFTEEMEGQTVDHFVRSATDFTRRQPALVFGLAALAGFFAFRTLKSAPAVRAPSIQPNERDLDETYG
jgi:hypothetical protein